MKENISGPTCLADDTTSIRNTGFALISLECIENGNSSLPVLLQTIDKVSEYICKNCIAYESQLNKVLEELESASAIIDILQREVPTLITTENKHNKQITTKEWTTTSSKNISTKPKKK